VSVRSHEDYQENLGAYVLGALPELEAEVLERHLPSCESCRAEVARLEVVTNALARSVPQVDPPPSLKASLMRTVNEEAALSRRPNGPSAAACAPGWPACSRASPWREHSPCWHWAL
jgi:anti-sigma factor RsiW